MHRILLIAKRDYIASIRTKAFLVGMIVAPLMFGGSFLGLALMKNKPDIAERRIAVIDRTGSSGAALVEAAAKRDREDLYDKTTGKQLRPVYKFENVVPAQDSAAQALALSNRVRSHDLYGFLEIGAGGPEKSNEVLWYSNESGIGNGRRWLTGPLNDGIHRLRLIKLGVDPARFDQALAPVTVQSMNPLEKNEATGRIEEPRKKGDLEGFAIPFGLVMLMLMIVMASAAPMLPAIAEDKMQRVFEMMLASATPFELIAGKVIAAIGRSLTSSLFYVTAAVLVLNSLAMIGLVPFVLLPWFLIYLVAEVMILCAIASALGAACGSPQDAQSLVPLLLAPVLIPIFVVTPILQQPNSSFATAMSLFPLFTPLLMMLRQALPGGVPAWQQWFALGEVVVTAGVICWVAARIFRVGILLQGKPPNLAELARWAFRG